MDFEYPNLDKVAHLSVLQEPSIPFENYSEIVDNILHKQLSEFVERKKDMNCKIYILYVFYKYMSTTGLIDLTRTILIVI